MLLERPLHDPYDDALPPQMMMPSQQLSHRISQRAVEIAAAAAAAGNDPSMTSPPPAALYGNYNDHHPSSSPHLASYMPAAGVSHLHSSSSAAAAGAADYGMTSMSRGTSLDSMGVSGGLGLGMGMGAGLHLHAAQASGSAPITTPNFGGGAMALDMMPDAIPDTPSNGGAGAAAAALAAGTNLTPMPPLQHPNSSGGGGGGGSLQLMRSASLLQQGGSESINSPAYGHTPLPPSLFGSSSLHLQQQHSQHSQQLQQQLQQHQQRQHQPQQQQHSLLQMPPPATPGAFQHMILSPNTPANHPQAFTPNDMNTQPVSSVQQQKAREREKTNNPGKTSGGLIDCVGCNCFCLCVFLNPQWLDPASPAPVSTPSSHALSTPQGFQSSSGYSAGGSIDQEDEEVNRR